MLRYFTYAERDFRRSPDRSDYRLNWEFWIAFRSKVRPVFHEEPHRLVESANFWVMPPNLRYHWLVDGGKTERAVFHFAFVPEPLQQLVRWRGHFSRTLSADELREARAIADAVAAASRRRDTLSPLVFQRAMLDLTLLGLRHEPSKIWSTLETQVADRVEHVVTWYKEHLHEAPKLGRAAAESHISVSHLRRLFQVYYRKSPKLVFDNLRLETASTLLATSTATLDDIASRTGFRSVTDFCRVFKKRFGHPPNEWRRTTNRARIA
jgi:AraC-like DNA-binding protein